MIKYYLYVTTIPACLTGEDIKKIVKGHTETYDSYDRYTKTDWDMVAGDINDLMGPEETCTTNPNTGNWLFSKKEAREWVEARENRKVSNLPICFEHEDGSITSYVLKRKEAE